MGVVLSTCSGRVDLPKHLREVADILVSRPVLSVDSLKLPRYCASFGDLL